MKFPWFQALFSLTFQMKNVTTKSNLSETVSKDQSSSTELFLVPLKDLLRFFVSIREENGTSGFLQDN